MFSFLRVNAIACCFGLVMCGSVPAIGMSQEKAAPNDKGNSKDEKPPSRGLGEPAGLTRLSPNDDIWIDTKRKLVVVDGKIALREGLLEMFACPKGTKEHESIVSVNCKAQFVHAGLVAVGAEPGKPVAFSPEYKPASGPVVEVWVLWKDEQGQNRKVRAQEWVQHTKTKKELQYPWVFAGSDLYVDETSGKKMYLADGGDFICVSNFTSALMDLPIPSSDSNSGLSFQAFSERIPPSGTPVRLVLEPKLDSKPPAKVPDAKVKAKEGEKVDKTKE